MKTGYEEVHIGSWMLFLMVLGVLHFVFCGYSKILLQRMKESLSLTTIDSRLDLGHSRAEIAAYARHIFS